MAIKPSTIEEIKGEKVNWINVRDTTKKETTYLEATYAFHPLDLKDCLPPTQRAKLIERPGYLFMILLFPIYDRKSRVIKSSEVDFFINKDTVVTVHENNLFPLIELAEKLKVGDEEYTKILAGTPADFLYEILSRLSAYCFPILVHLSNDIDEAEDRILAREHKTLESAAVEILRIKTNIVNFRKAIRPFKYVTERLILTAPQFFSVARLQIFFDRLIEQTREIWDLLENYKDTIDALHETNESMLAASTNSVMKALTVFAVVILPASLIITLFSTSFPKFPLMNNPNGFWVMIAIAVGAVGALLVLFKKKKLM
jgi:magnesium transporter